MTQTVLGTYKSSSSSTMYNVKVDNANGRLWCDCRGWKMKRANQGYHCQHTDRVRYEKTQQGWVFEERWDEHVYVLRRPDGLAAAAPQPQPTAKQPEWSAKPTATTPPSLEQVRQATRKPGYDVVRRTRRNIEVE